VWFRVSRSEVLDQKAASLGDALRGYAAGEASERPVAAEARASAPIRSEPLLAPPLQVQELSELLRAYRPGQGAQAEAGLAGRLAHGKDQPLGPGSLPDGKNPLASPFTPTGS